MYLHTRFAASKSDSKSGRCSYPITSYSFTLHAAAFALTILPRRA